MRKIFFLPLLGFLGLVGFFYQGFSLDPFSKSSVMIGRQAPQTFPLSPNMSVVHFFASWEEDCQREATPLQMLAQVPGISVVGVAYKDAQLRGDAWLEKQRIPYTQIINDPSGEIGLEWGLRNIPETYVIDSAGHVVYHHSGALTSRIIQDVFLPLIKKVGDES